MKTCRYCDSLAKNTNRTASEVASIITGITKRDFNITHIQFQVRNTGRWIIPPQGCLQWLHASMDDRIKSLGNKPSVCTVCLAAPGKWNAAKTTCDVSHSVRRRRDGHINQLCLEEKCHRSFLICKEHDNKQHPFQSTAGIWVKKINNSHPELREAQAVDEVAMLVDSPGELSETPDFTEIAQTAYESFINYFKATFKMKSQLPQVDANDLPPTLCVCGHWCEQQCTAVTKAKSDLLIMQKQLEEQTNKAGLALEPPSSPVKTSSSKNKSNQFVAPPDNFHHYDLAALI